jgi:Fe-S cluster assembly iron-binding protein IscA
MKNKENIMNIKVSEEANLNLYNLLKEHKEYNCVRFSFISSCCSHAKVDVILDELKENDLSENIDGITFVYSNTLEEKVNSINLDFTHSGFMLKCEPNAKVKDCSSCGTSNKSSGCKGCNH